MIYIITGHYGSGKTNIAVNLALENTEKTTVIDLDIVNYYFRTADFKELFAEKNIELLASPYANSNLDIPVINMQIEGIGGDIIIDVGGDDAGAAALGVFADYIKTQYYKMYYVFNMYRYMTNTPSEALELMYEIEATSKLKHTALINNSNLGNETTTEIVKNSFQYAEKLQDISKLPLLFTAIDKNLSENIQNVKPIEIFVKKPWDTTET
jgi:hypothetical protein